VNKLGVTLTAMAGARALIESRARAVVDYSLARRATLRDLAVGRVTSSEVCDAQAYLVRAARYHGHEGEDPCPVCGRVGLARVNYTYGDCFRADVNGRARPDRELLALAEEVAEFTVYLVEVCSDCRWNHLLASYVLGTGIPVERRARSQK
jgi:hypothetical protein